MSQLNLVLAIPQGSVIATSLGVEGLALHRSPGAGRYFQGREVYVDLAVEGGKAGFTYMEEGGWRDAAGDTAVALDSCKDGKKRTKTALSNNGFSITPIESYLGVSLAKTGGQTLPLQAKVELARTKAHTYAWGQTLRPDDIAELAGSEKPAARKPRLYMVLAPVELVVLSNLTPAEYAWYATHRPGKVFRQVMFTELEPSGRGLVADMVYEAAVAELTADPTKKTKTVYTGGSLNRLGYQSWVGYGDGTDGGLYMGDRDHTVLWKLPAAHPRAWDRAE